MTNANNDKAAHDAAASAVASEPQLGRQARYSDFAVSRLASFSRIRADLPERSRK